MIAPLVTRFECPHGGKITTKVVTNVQANGKPVLVAREALVAGCSAPNPCVRVIFPAGSSRAKAHGESLLTAESVGLCMAADDQPGGAALVVETQPMVSAS